jgi:hypothetical protein
MKPIADRYDSVMNTSTLLLQPLHTMRISLVTLCGAAIFPMADDAWKILGQSVDDSGKEVVGAG